jgi:hypothetical protein
MCRQDNFGGTDKSLLLANGQGCRRIGEAWPRLYLNDCKKTLLLRDHINLTRRGANATGQYIPTVSL